ncbi:hypothetical protein ACFVUS_12675 [Nocardia sp. NPDC058058]|uniref:hypothetical protein n=1 Tax=Nocardia sp. NPDC058058 TaxID=3346317 RepID=UPI0036DACD6D
MSTDELPDDVRHAYEVYRWAGREIEGLEEQRKAARSVIEEFLGESEELMVDGRKALTWYRSESRVFDQALAIQIYPDLDDKARKTKRTRSFRVVSDE